MRKRRASRDLSKMGVSVGSRGIPPDELGAHLNYMYAEREWPGLRVWTGVDL